jgi:hypothetical protein
MQVALRRPVLHAGGGGAVRLSLYELQVFLHSAHTDSSGRSP